MIGETLRPMHALPPTQDPGTASLTCMPEIAHDVRYAS